MVNWSEVVVPPGNSVIPFDPTTGVVPSKVNAIEAVELGLCTIRYLRVLGTDIPETLSVGAAEELVTVALTHVPILVTPLMLDRMYAIMVKY